MTTVSMVTFNHLPAEQGKKDRSSKDAMTKSLDKARGQARINIGKAFQQQRQLRDLNGLKGDAIIAVFLLPCLFFYIQCDNVQSFHKAE